MQIQNNPLFGTAVQFRNGVREFNPGGGGLEPDLAYRVEVLQIEADHKPGFGPQFVFRTVVRELGFDGIERSVYVDMPLALNASEPDAKKRKRAEIDHDVMLTTIVSLGYTSQQAAQIAAQGNVPYGTVFQQAPGRGMGFVFARAYDKKVFDKATNTVVKNAITGEVETEERISVDFCTPDHYAKHSASGRAQRAQAAQGGGNTGGYNSQPSYGAPVAAAAPAPWQVTAPQAAPTAQPSWNAAPAPVPQGYTPPPAPNGQYNQPQAGGIMGTMQQPRA